LQWVKHPAERQNFTVDVRRVCHAQHCPPMVRREPSMRQLEYEVGKDDGSAAHARVFYLHAGVDARAPKSAHFIFKLQVSIH